MKKILILAFGLLIAIPAICQVQTLVDISKTYHRKDIQITDGLTYKWIVVPNNDTARYFIPGADTYEAIVTFKKKGTTTPPQPQPTIIKEAENWVAANGVMVENVNYVCCNAASSWIKYSIDFTTPRTKAILNYSRGDTGSGTVYLRTGSITGPIIATFTTTYTATTPGQWNVYKDTITVPMTSQSGITDIYLTYGGTAAANLNQLKFPQ